MIRRLCFVWVVFAGGAVLMALEILASRILAPSFGNSVYVWGSIISVVLAALSAGYVIGGRIADRMPTMAGLARMVSLAGAAQAVLLLAGPRWADALGDATGGSPAGTLLAAAVLFAPVSVLLATVSPYAIRLAAGDVTRIGGTAGGLYAVSTAGSLVGTLGCTFLLIPFLELGQALAFLVGATAVTALVAVAASERRELPAAALGVLLLVLAGLGAPGSRGGGGLVHERMTPYQTLVVRDEGEVRYLESDRTRHGGVRRKDGAVALPYLRAVPAALLFQPEIERVLILGMGGGNLAAYLRREIPGLEVDLVDIDPAVPEVAREYMGFREDAGIRVHVADARRFVEEAEGRWDLIFSDTYIGLAVPFHVTTEEFLREARERLAPGGVFALNLASGLDRPFPRAMVRTMGQVFPRIHLLRVRGSNNLLVFGTAGPDAVSPEELVRRARRLDRRFAFEPSLVELAAGRLAPGAELSDVPVLTDRFAPVDRLIHLRSPTLEGH